MTTKPQHYMFLEIFDKDINAFLAMVNRIVHGKTPTKLAHLTVRGPYSKRISRSTFDQCKEKMKYDVLHIEGAGRFSNTNEEVSYLKVNSLNLKRIWNKPDFPVTRFGFNPHLSIYRGKDGSFADFLTEFFNSSRIKLSCSEYQLVPYLTRNKQCEIPNSPPSSMEDVKRKINTGSIDGFLLGQLKTAVSNYRLTSSKMSIPKIGQLT